MAVVMRLAERLSQATPSQQSLHNNFIVSMNTTKRGLVRSAFYLVRIAETKVYRALGFTSIHAYARDAVGLTSSQTTDLIYMGRKLSNLPEIAEALDAGALSWNKARMIIAKATPETEVGLIDIVRNQSNDSIRDFLAKPGRAKQSPVVEHGDERIQNPSDPEVRGQHSPVDPPRHCGKTPSTTERPGAKPSAPRDTHPARTLHATVCFTAEEYARWEAAVAAERSQGNKLPLGPLFLEALERSRTKQDGHSTPADGPGTLMVILECPRCGRASINTSRGEQPAPRALIEASRCDALAESETSGRLVRRHVVSLRLRRAVMRRDRLTCQAAGCSNNRNLEIHHRVPASRGGRTELDNLVTLCRHCHRALHAQDDAARTADAAAENLP